MYWVDMALMIGYTILFIGLILVMGNFVPLVYLPFFVVPYLVTSSIIIFYNPEDKMWIS